LPAAGVATAAVPPPAAAHCPQTFFDANIKPAFGNHVFGGSNVPLMYTLVSKEVGSALCP
jgi:hypothetical protein